MKGLGRNFKVLSGRTIVIDTELPLGCSRTFYRTSPGSPRTSAATSCEFGYSAAPAPMSAHCKYPLEGLAGLCCWHTLVYKNNALFWLTGFLCVVYNAGSQAIALVIACVPSTDDGPPVAIHCRTLRDVFLAGPSCAIAMGQGLFAFKSEKVLLRSHAFLQPCSWIFWGQGGGGGGGSEREAAIPIFQWHPALNC